MSKKIFVFAATAALVALAGCSSSSSNSGSSMASSMMSKAVSAVAPNDPWAIMTRMRSAQESATSYRSKMVFNNLKGEDMEVDTELVCPSKQHTKVMNSGTTSEITIIDGMQYINSGGRTFSHEMPNHMSNIAGCAGASGSSGAAGMFGGGGNHSSFSLSDLKDLEKYKQNAKFEKGGISNVEGNSCQEWRLTYNDPDSARNGSYSFCVGVSDGLPYRISFDSGEGGKGEVTYWDWNSKAISINPPAS